MHLETIGFSATAPGTSGAAAAAFSGDSLQLKRAAEGSRIIALAHIADQQASGFQQIIHPSGHDTTRGWRSSVTAAQIWNLIPKGVPLPFATQETLAVTIAGSATAGDIEQGALLMWYENSPNLNSYLITIEELMRRAVDLTTVMVTLACGTGGGWTGAELITAESDLLKANRDYAVIGASNQVQSLAVGIRAPDFAGQRIAIPGNETDQEMTSNWFTDLAKRSGLPCIPCFNSANKGNIFVDAAQDENGSDPIVSIVLALLS